ncbi:MAG: Lrp/AsnC family transcriptional regulator [Leucobacter sp.]|nr:Lrp/AsnC family transcriptional regulator [Leucobacter sp.]
MNEIQLTETDRRIVRELARDGRLPYKDLAMRVGLPISTCHGRVRALEAAGVIRGYRADIDPAAAGLGVEALISLTVNGHRRAEVPAIAEQLRDVPGVQRVFLIGGDRDIVAHVACESVPALRNLISTYLGKNPAFEQTRTSLVFEQLVGNAPA